MSLDFVNWFFDKKKDGCGSAWFIMAAAMWEGWKGLASQEAKPLHVTDGMALDFHHALTDGSIGSGELEEIKVGLRAALCNVTAPPAPAVPDAVDFSDLDTTSQDREVIEAIAECKGWNACRAAMLAQPVSSGCTFNSPVIPDGWKMVPVEPTAEMINAALASGALSIRTAYSAMLAAAPEGGNDHDTRR